VVGFPLKEHVVVVVLLSVGGAVVMKCARLPLEVDVVVEMGVVLPVRVVVVVLTVFMCGVVAVVLVCEVFIVVGRDVSTHTGTAKRSACTTQRTASFIVATSR